MSGDPQVNVSPHAAFEGYCNSCHEDKGTVFHIQLGGGILVCVCPKCLLVLIAKINAVVLEL